MKVECVVLGDFETNCYVVRSSESARECLIIDPGFSGEVLVEFLQRNGFEPKRIWLTHGHCDHIAGIKPLQAAFGPLPVSIGAEDAEMLTSGKKNLSLLMGMYLKFPPADELLRPGDVLCFDGLEFSVLATPGHTPGGLSFYAPKEAVVFTGDALFAGGIGRTDFPGGNMALLTRSIRESLYRLPDQTRVYSGHGPETTIVAEKHTNPFVKES